MDTFRKKVKVRVAAGGVMLIIGAAFVIMIVLFGERITRAEGPGFLRDFAFGFSFGLICAFLVVAVFYISRSFAALSNEEKLKKLYIGETDERNLLIQQKIGKIGLNASMIGLFIGASVSAYFDLTLFFTLAGTCLFVSAIKSALKLYYRNKY